MTTLLLEVCASDHRYFIPRTHVDRMENLRLAAIPVEDERGRPVVVRELAPLLGEPTTPAAFRHTALCVILRRRTVLLLVNRVESLEAVATVVALPSLLRHRLAAPWVAGVIVAGDEPSLVLDLRRIAADVALGAA